MHSWISVMITVSALSKYIEYRNGLKLKFLILGMQFSQCWIQSDLNIGNDQFQLLECGSGNGVLPQLCSCYKNSTLFPLKSLTYHCCLLERRIPSGITPFNGVSAWCSPSFRALLCQASTSIPYSTLQLLSTVSLILVEMDLISRAVMNEKSSYEPASPASRDYSWDCLANN